MAKPEPMDKPPAAEKRRRIDADLMAAVVVITLAILTIVLILTMPFGY